MASKRWRRRQRRREREEEAERIPLRVRLAPARPVVLILVCIGAYVLGVWGLWEYARPLETAPVRAHPVLLDGEPPAGMTGAEVDELLAAGRVEAGASLYDADLLARLAAGYEANPWVRRAISVRRRFPDRIEVKLALRRPFAYVRRGRVYVLVDAGGVRLPRLPEVVPDSSLPIIEGARGAMPGAGERWPDEAVCHALGVLARVDGRLDRLSEPHRLTVRSAHLESGERPAVVFRTNAGLDIIWGECDGRVRASLPTTEEKLDALENMLAGLGERAGARHYVNVRFRPPCVGLRGSP